MLAPARSTRRSTDEPPGPPFIINKGSGLGLGEAELTLTTKRSICVLFPLPGSIGCFQSAHKAESMPRPSKVDSSHDLKFNSSFGCAFPVKKHGSATKKIKDEMSLKDTIGTVLCQAFKGISILIFGKI